jgi:hypothetical protein
MDFDRLESRDCPATLVATAGSFVAGLDPFPGYGGQVEFAMHGGLTVITADRIPHVKVYDSGLEVASFYAYDPAFDGGINVATDGQRVAAGTDQGAPHVREFTLHGVEVASFYQGSRDSTSGVRVAYDFADAIRVATPIVVRPDARMQIYLDGASDTVTRGVAEIFNPFDVGVTNGYPSRAEPERVATVIVGGEGEGTQRGRAVVGGVFQQSEWTSFPARVFSDSLTEAQQIRAAAHEAAHLFGAVHVPDPSSIMFGGIEGGRGFDSLNFRILSQRLGVR